MHNASEVHTTAAVQTARDQFESRLRAALSLPAGAPLPARKRAFARASDGGAENDITNRYALARIADVRVFHCLRAISFLYFMRAAESSRRAAAEHLNGAITYGGIGSSAIPASAIGPNSSREGQRANARFAQAVVRQRLEGKTFSGEQILSANAESAFSDQSEVRRFLRTRAGADNASLRWQFVFGELHSFSLCKYQRVMHTHKQNRYNEVK